MLKDNPRFARFVSGVPEQIWLSTISRAQLFLLGKHKDPDDVRLVRMVRRERTCLLTAYECYTMHDYSVLNGVKTAFTEFFADKPEAPIELPSTQCMIIKV